MKLLAIDGNSILNRAFYGVRALMNKKGMYTNAIFGFLNILLKLQKDYPSDLVAITFDLKAKTFRHKQYEEYKANRKGMPEELRSQMQPLKDLLRALGYTILEKEGYEADDILGTLSRMCNEKNIKCIIATGDRDSLQLITENTNVCLVKTKENLHCDIEQIQIDYGIKPIQIIDLKALMGDSSDNIPGVKGIGEKTALNLIKESQTIENLYENIDEIKMTPRVKKLLMEGKDNAFLSKELATIYLEVPLDCDLESLTVKEKDEQKVSDILTDLELFSFFDKLGVKSIGQLQAEDEQNENKKIQIEVLENLTIEEINNLLKENGKIDFILIEDSLYFTFNDKIVICKDNVDDVILQTILKSDLPKRTFMAKRFFKLANDNHLNLTNLKFDLELGAYLLNVSSKNYELSNLIQKYLPYSAFDVQEEYQNIAPFSYLCDEILKQLEEEQMLSLLEDIELPLCEVLASMEQEGFKIDLEKLKEYGVSLQSQIDDIKQKIFDYAGREFNPNSTKELGVVLFEDLGLPAKKKTKTGYSTNAEVLESLLGKHPIIESLLDYRRLTKLHSTYIVGLEKVIMEDGRVHSTFNQSETRTGRISSTEPNVQNIPIRTEQGSKIREFFVAKDGYTLIDADYSQIELRILAHIAEDKNMQQAFIDNVDIHTMTASKVFKTPIEQVTSELRGRAKAINFGIVYGIGAFSLSKDIHVSVAEAKAYIDEYLKTYSGVKKYMDDVVEFAKKNGYVKTIYNRKRDLAEINSTNKIVQANAKRIALNTPIQGTAADIIKIAMIKVYNKLKTLDIDAKLILQVHDELIIEAPKEHAKMIADILKEEMENAVNLSVRLICDANIGDNWLEAKG